MDDLTILYRYFPVAAAINTIERRQFRVGRILELNDPFEWSLCVTANSPEELEEGQREMDQMRADFFNEKWGVISFCKVVDDPVIWSHYADRHRGIAIKVGCQSDEVGVELLPVTYQAERACVPYIPVEEREQRIEELRPAFERFFRYKAPSWGYEHEVRGVVELKRCRIADGMFLWSIPDGFIKSVIIGLRSTISYSYIRQALDLNGFRDVAVQRMKENSKTYSIVPGATSETHE